MDSEPVARSAGSGVSVERDSKVRETGNGAEDDLDLDRENVQRSESSAGSHSKVGESGNVEAADLDRENGNKSDETVERRAGIAGSHSNVGQPGNVEAADLARSDDIDSENVEISEHFGGSRSTIVESISLEQPIQQRSLVNYTDSESLLSSEGTDDSAFRGEIVIAGGPSYIRGETLYLAGDDVDSESFNRSDSTFGIIDTSSQVEIAPEVSNLSVGSRSFPAIDVSTASRRQILQEETETEVRNISERYISVQESPIEVSTLT